MFLQLMFRIIDVNCIAKRGKVDLSFYSSEKYNNNLTHICVHSGFMLRSALRDIWHILLHNNEFDDAKT